MFSSSNQIQHTTTTTRPGCAGDRKAVTPYTESVDKINQKIVQNGETFWEAEEEKVCL